MHVGNPICGVQPDSLEDVQPGLQRDWCGLPCGRPVVRPQVRLCWDVVILPSCQDVLPRPEREAHYLMEWYFIRSRHDVGLGDEGKEALNSLSHGLLFCPVLPASLLLPGNPSVRPHLDWNNGQRPSHRLTASNLIVAWPQNQNKITPIQWCWYP